jgi:glycosyl transferase family 25
MNIKVISLSRSKARRDSFRSLNRHLTYDFFDAVDGATLSQEFIDDCGLFGRGLGYTRGAYGCALSHRALWETAVRQRGALTIAEDDAIFRLDFVERCRETLSRLPRDWDVVVWGWNFDFYLVTEFMSGISPAVMRFDQEGLRRSIESFRRLDEAPLPMRLWMCWGTLAYSISPGGAEKFMKGCFPLNQFSMTIPSTRERLRNMGVDSAMNALYAGAKSFVSFPPLAISRNEHPLSTVQKPAAPRKLKRILGALRTRLLKGPWLPPSMAS